MSDIRKWFLKQHDKGNRSAPAKPTPPSEKPAEKPVEEVQANPARRKSSKYFSASAAADTSTKQIVKDEPEIVKTPAKRKAQKTKGEIDDDEVEVPSAKKFHKDDDEDFELHDEMKKASATCSSKKLKSTSGARFPNKSADEDENEEDEHDGNDAEAPVKVGGRGKGGRGSGVAARGRGGGGGGGRGRGGFMNFGERKDPPHKGEKEVPEGAPDCLAGLTFVISGTLDSLEREEAEDLIKRHGGRVTGSVSKKTNYLLADEDIGGKKSLKAKELGTTFLTEDGLFDMIHKSKPVKSSRQENLKTKPVEKAGNSHTKSSPLKHSMKDDQVGSLSKRGVVSSKSVQPSISSSPSKKKCKSGDNNMLTWTEKYKPKVPNDIVGNQSLIKQLHDWLSHWDEHYLHNGQNGKGKKQNDSGFKKAVLLSGSPGIGKSTSAKLVSQMLGFQAIEVNASDNRGKADAKIFKGVGGNIPNSIKELVSNKALCYDKDRSKYSKSILIMDEVDGMSAGDRGGVSDLIANIKISKIPIICICNDRYSQKLKSLINYCMPLNFRKPTKQQMAKRLMQIASTEGLSANEIALEELADRVNGDMRMAVNQLQYMSTSQSVLQYDDIKERLLSGSKDEDISPFTAVDKLFGFNGGKLRMDERIDLSMSDPDLVPLIIQENYINYRPVSAGKDENGVKRMNLLARSADSIADGDIFNVQIRRYRQWQLSQASSFASSIIPAALMHGSREVLEQGERNYNRFGGWLGKNSTMGKNTRLLEDVHVHILASQGSHVDRDTLRLEYLPLLLKQLTDPLCLLPKDEAVCKVVEFMDAYSLSQEDFDTIVELSKFQGHPNPMDGVHSTVKAALTKAYKQGSSNRVVRAADLVTLPGQKKAPKKRIAAILDPVDSDLPLPEENGDISLESEEEDSAEDNTGDATKSSSDQKPQLDLHTDKSKGIQVQLDLKSNDKQDTKRKPAAKPRGSAASAKKVGGSGSGKRKR